MAPQKRKTGGRVTPAGTRPSDKRRTPTTARAGGSDAGSEGATSHGAAHHYDSGRYTAPIPRSAKESPSWVPMLMLGFLIVGALLIMLRYLVWDTTNVPMVLGMALLLAGLYTGTKWK